MIKSWLADFKKFLSLKRYGVRSKEEYLREVSAFVKWVGDKNFPPSKIDYQGYLELLGVQKKRPKTISKNLSALKIYSDFLHQYQKTKSDIAHNLPHPTIPKRGINILTSVEIEKLRRSFLKDPLSPGLFETILQTGLTISELSNLRKVQVKLVKGPRYGQIKLKTRTVPINNRLEAILKSLVENDSEYVFANRRGKPMNVRYIRYKLDKGFKKIGLKNFYVNDLRHNFIFHQLKKGIDLGTVASWVGFKNLSSLNPFLKKLGRKSTGMGYIHEI